MSAGGSFPRGGGGELDESSSLTIVFAFLLLHGLLSIACDVSF